MARENFHSESITRDHILQGIDKIEREKIELIPSTKYEVIINGKNYPPKEVMRYAVKELNEKAVWEKRGGEETNKFLQQLGFEIVQKGYSKSIESLIEEYKHKIRTDGLKDEIYKWELLGKYRGRPDVDASGFAEEIRGVNYSNLIYRMAPAVIKHIAGQKPEEYRECFKRLFDESVDLGKRIVTFIESVDSIYRSVENYTGAPSHHDERAVATFLAYHDPDKYAFYKSSFYKEFCRLMNEPFEKKNLKYVHYLRLLNMFIDEYLIEDEELLQLIDSAIPENAFKDPNRKLLAQDILYTMLEKEQEGEEQIINVDDSSIYKISMSDFKNQIDDLIRQKVVVVHSETHAIARSTLTQGKTFQTMNIGDYFYLTCGNRTNSMKLVGKIIGPAEPIDVADDEGKSRGKFLQRRFETVATAKSDHMYKEEKKWWAPNSNSTCIKIRDNEIEKANELIFKPYFNVKFMTSNMKDKSIEESNTQSEFSLPLNLILYGPPGTGKTFNSINKAISIINPGFDLTQDREFVKAEFDRLASEGRIAFTTFHQSMSYEEFIEGIKPIEPIDDESNMQYAIEDGILKRLCKRGNFEEKIEWLKEQSSILEKKKPVIAKSGKSQFGISFKGGKTFSVSPVASKKKEPEYRASIENIRRVYEGANRKEVYNPTYVVGILNYLYQNGLQKYEDVKSEDYSMKVLIIDEINRGNIAQIFGELITLIEEDKRLGNEESLEAILPYSKEKFGVPRNLYIIGTMNTADRSVEALDTALRRRFSFEEISPDSALIKNQLSGLDLRGLMDTINKRIIKLLDKDHQIGHSYFMKIKSIQDLKVVFSRNIIPLLQEYFYGDYGKIGLVIGEKFFDFSTNTDRISFANFDNYDTSELEERRVYLLKDVSKMSEIEFLEALKILLNNE